MAVYEMWAVEFVNRDGKLIVHVFDDLRMAKAYLQKITAHDLKADLWEL